MKSELAQLTKDLIAFKTTHDRREELRDCAEFVVQWFNDSPYKVRHYLHNEIPSIVVTRGTKTPKIFFCGHLDVVAGNEDQFEPREEDGKIIGRGALDMKSGDAAIMMVMKHFEHTDYDIGLILTGDEEIGGENGIGYLLEQEGYSCDVAVIPDGGLCVNSIVTKQKGVLHGILRATGTPTHGSRPWMGKNAANLLIDALEKVQSLFAHKDTFPEDNWVTTCSIGKISGGSTFNQVCGEAEAYLDIRLTEDISGKDMIAKIEAVLPEGVRFDISLCEPMFFVASDNPYVEAYMKSVQSIGLEPVRIVEHGASDARYFSSRGIPVIVSQPEGAGHHQHDEWVNIDSIENYYKALVSFVENV